MFVNDPLCIKSVQHVYSYFLGNDFLSSEFWHAQAGKVSQVLIITHPELASRADHLAKQLRLVCSEVNIEIVASGEQSKTLHCAEKIWQRLVALNYTREATLIALGGGMIGDLVGFCAGCYMRGIDYIQIPTTLLAQLDSSIGGKTAVNITGYKNMVGLFYPPKLIAADISFLNSLPERAFLSAFGELFKYGLAFDAEFFNWLEQNLDKLVQRDEASLLKAVRWSANIKVGIVNKDEKEQIGQRMLLNFGHTIAHALERLCPDRLYHGEAVGIGLLIALRLSEKVLGNCISLERRLLKLLGYIEMPVDIPKGISSQQILATIVKDKKNRSQQNRWVLLERLGKAVIVEAVPTALIKSVLRQGREAYASIEHDQR